jgi:hypothetical protein
MPPSRRPAPKTALNFTKRDLENMGNTNLQNMAYELMVIEDDELMVIEDDESEEKDEFYEMLKPVLVRELWKVSKDDPRKANYLYAKHG